MTRRITTTRYSRTCLAPGCAFRVEDSASKVVAAAWDAHSASTGHLYSTDVTTTTAKDAT